MQNGKEKELVKNEQTSDENRAKRSRRSAE